MLNIKTDGFTINDVPMHKLNSDEFNDVTTLLENIVRNGRKQYKHVLATGRTSPTLGEHIANLEAQILTTIERYKK